MTEHLDRQLTNVREMNESQPNKLDEFTTDVTDQLGTESSNSVSSNEKCESDNGTDKKACNSQGPKDVKTKPPELESNSSETDQQCEVFSGKRRLRSNTSFIKLEALSKPEMKTKGSAKGQANKRSVKLDGKSTMKLKVGSASNRRNRQRINRQRTNEVRRRKRLDPEYRRIQNVKRAERQKTEKETEPCNDPADTKVSKSPTCKKNNEDDDEDFKPSGGAGNKKNLSRALKRQDPEYRRKENLQRALRRQLAKAKQEKEIQDMEEAENEFLNELAQDFESQENSPPSSEDDESSKTSKASQQATENNQSTKSLEGLNHREKERIARAIRRQDPAYREKERQALALKRQNPTYRTLENLRLAMKRKSTDYQMIERAKLQLKRRDPDYARRERERIKARRIQKKEREEAEKNAGKIKPEASTQN